MASVTRPAIPARQPHPLVNLQIRDTFFSATAATSGSEGLIFRRILGQLRFRADEGLTRYDTTAHNLYFCNGTTWQAVNAAGAGGITPGCGANGTLSTQQATTINVAAGCTVQFKVWGAGGGSGCYSGGGWGGGGYATITLGPLGSATTYYLVVGGGGGVDITSYSPGLTGYLGGPASGGACGAGCGRISERRVDRKLWRNASAHCWRRRRFTIRLRLCRAFRITSLIRR